MLPQAPPLPVNRLWWVFRLGSSRGLLNCSTDLRIKYKDKFYIFNKTRKNKISFGYLESTLLSIDRENVVALRGDNDGLQSLGVDTAGKKKKKIGF